jgi:putative ABC transport system permease protein
MAASRLRTALTTLTVGIGAGTMALLVSLTSSALRTIMAGVDAVGGHELVFVEPKAPVASGRASGAVAYPLTADDAAALRGRVPGARHVDYLMALRDQPLRAGSKTLDVDVAVGAAFPYLMTQEMLVGAPLDDTDRDRKVLLSEPIARSAFGAPEAALGRGVVLWQERYVVSGVTRDKPAYGFNIGSVSRSRVVFVSTSTALQAEGVVPHGFAVMRDDGAGDHDLEMGVAASVVRHRHRGADDVELFDMRSFLRPFDVVFAGIRVIVALIAGLSLVIAGAGIMNVMLASIRQRVTEVGVRRALGASSADIRRQFLVEAVMIAGAGGAAGSASGTALAWGAGVVVGQAMPAWRGEISPVAAVVAAVAAGTTGLVFGMRPARRAAGLSVVECLRGVDG